MRPLFKTTNIIIDVVVSINLIDSKRKENLVGSTEIKDDFNKAIVKAILKATNRRILTKEK